jgi:hydroxymethylglutaryl-CoA lyase
MRTINQNRIVINEVGPRDGFQIEPKFIPTQLKLEIIKKLSQSGLQEIQVASFVHPEKVPQMADAEKVMANLPKIDGVSFNALALNIKGVERAQNCGVTDLEIGVSASDTHSRKNTGASFDEALLMGDQMIRLAKKYDMKVRACIHCSFGCIYEGATPVDKVMQVAKHFVNEGADLLMLGDTTGMAIPPAVADLLNSLQGAFAGTRIGLHLHDTRGMGLVNLMEALKFGITHFDTSMGGLGGCPFVPGAAGNIATEDTVYLLNALNYQTGVDIKTVAECSRKMETFLEKPLAGKLYRILTSIDSHYVLKNK